MPGPASSSLPHREARPRRPDQLRRRQGPGSKSSPWPPREWASRRSCWRTIEA